jgi:hypothetical protein
MRLRFSGNGLRAEPDSLGRSERGVRGVRRSTPRNMNAGGATFYDVLVDVAPV